MKAAGRRRYVRLGKNIEGLGFACSPHGELAGERAAAMAEIDAGGRTSRATATSSVEDGRNLVNKN
jgi:hypothetical protein